MSNIYTSADQLIGQGCVALAITVAGNNQVIGEGTCHVQGMGDQRLTLPLHQPFILPAHALAASARQKQDGTR